MNKTKILISVFLAAFFFSKTLQAQPISKAYVSEAKARYGRSAVFTDSLLYRLFFENFHFSDMSQWRKISANKDGYFEDKSLRGSYLYARFNSEKEKIMLLEARGHRLVYVNGNPHIGDVYDYGYMSVPVQIKEGTNHLLFRAGRGKMKAALRKPESPVLLNTGDLTLPDILLTDTEPLYGAVHVLNSTTKDLYDLIVECRIGDKMVATRIPPVSPVTVRKVPFQIPVGVSDTTGEISMSIGIKNDGQIDFFDQKEVKIKLKKATDKHDRTFVSKIDSSVQYYSVTPGRYAENQTPAMILSLHGASVEARNQGRCYTHKDWAVVVAPTNRRPYGFDWEDWGRLDAMEVLELTEKEYETDPRRTYLTGHSMGGHGTWQVGATFPARFAAIAPSAGWYSFWSYAGKDFFEDATPMQEMFLRAASPSRTLKLLRNYLHHGVSILHGDADQTVPVDQARFMRGKLAEFHPDFCYREYAGGGHWWGDECVNWEPFFDFFKLHQIPAAAEKKELEFITACPGVSAVSHWLSIDQQRKSYEFSRAKIRQDTEKSVFEGTTENIRRLSLDISHLTKRDTVVVMLDSQRLELLNAGERERLFLLNDGKKWQFDQITPVVEKYPARYGNFKSAFDNGVVLVYGTRGSAEEREWAYNKARFDAESFLYRGNGSVYIIRDRDFDPKEFKNRNVVLYGNSRTNRAWSDLLGNCPVQVNDGSIELGDVQFSGADLAVYFVYPRPDSPVASVGVVGGTGFDGMKAAMPANYFISGSGFPDLMIFSKEIMRKGFEGVRAAGFFGYDWSVEKGDWIMQ